MASYSHKACSSYSRVSISLFNFNINIDIYHQASLESSITPERFYNKI